MVHAIITIKAENAISERYARHAGIRDGPSHQSIDVFIHQMYNQYIFKNSISFYNALKETYAFTMINFLKTFLIILLKYYSIYYVLFLLPNYYSEFLSIFVSRLF